MIGCCNDARFNVFVDYISESGDWVFIDLGSRNYSQVEVPHNCEVTANIMRDYQLSALIPIKVINLGFRNLHLQIQSRFPPDHAEKCFGQPCNKFVWCLKHLLFFQESLR